MNKIFTSGISSTDNVITMQMHKKANYNYHVTIANYLAFCITIWAPCFKEKTENQNTFIEERSLVCFAFLFTDSFLCCWQFCLGTFLLLSLWFGQTVVQNLQFLLSENAIQRPTNTQNNDKLKGENRLRYAAGNDFWCEITYH